MTVKLRRPARGTGRPAYATGGAVVRVPASQPGRGPNPEQQRARRALQNAGVDRPRPEQLAHVARAVGQDNNRGGPASPVGPAVARALQMGGSNGSMPQPEPVSGIPPSVLAALSPAPGYARGGAVAPGLPAPMFRPQELPTVPTPGLASPHGLIAARHRSHFAAGGAALPSHILAALALRPHFDDGGQVVGFDDAGQPIYGSGSEAGAIYGASPAVADQDSGQGQPDNTWSQPAPALPSASRDPSGLLQNGTDTTDLDTFWAGKANAMPSPQWSNTRAGLAPGGGPVDAAPAATPASPSAAADTAPAHAAAALAPVYNPMADPTVRASLHLATGGVARAGLPQSVLDALRSRPHRLHFEDGGDAGAGGANGGSNGGDDNTGHGGDNANAAGASSNNSNGSAGSGDNGASGGTGGGVGGIGGAGGDGTGSGNASGGHSDAATGGADRSAAPAGAQSDAATGAANGTNAGLGAVSSGASATSGPVGSINGSDGAPTAGGFSPAGAPATGGFGNFGATPAATSNPAGLSGGTPTASSLSGQTATQSAAAEARAGGDPGEDGTATGGVGVTTTGAFGSFGPSPSSPFGSIASAQQQFGGTQASDLAGSSLSPMGQQLGQIGLGAGVPSAMAANPNGFASPGAYGLSSVTGGLTPGMDNFSSVGNVQQSMLGPQGWTGFADAEPTTTYNTFSGLVPGSIINAMQQDVPGKEAAQTDLADLSKSFTPDYSGTAFGPDGKLSEPGNTLTGSTPTAGLGAAPTGTTPGLNADGDPTAVGGISALTIHGPMAEAAYGGYDAPGAPTGFGGITDKQAFDARQGVIANGGVATPAQSATISGYTAQQNSPMTRTAGLGVAPSSAPASSVAGLGASPDASASSPGGTSGLPGVVAGAPTGTSHTTDPASLLGQPPSLTVSGVPGVPNDSYHIGLHTIEGGVLNGQVDPNNPSHYGPAQFTQATFSGVARNHPELGISPNMSMFSATAEQYSAITSALTQDDAAALQKAGLPTTPANLYMMHNLGAPVALAALRAGPDATLAQAGIPGSYVAANPSIYGGLQTIGQVQARVAGMLEKGAAGASTATPNGMPASAQQALGPSYTSGAGLGFGDPSAPTTFSPSGFSFSDTGYVAPPSTDEPTAAPLTISPAPAPEPVTRTVTTPAPYGVTAEASQALGNYGMESTPANAFAASVLGLGVASQVMNGVPSDPVEAAGVSAAAVAANPSLFSGVKTIGDLQANITKAAETAGTTTSTVTEPGVAAPAAAAAPTSSIPASVRAAAALSPAWGGPGSYSNPSDPTSGFGMQQIAAGIPATVTNAGTLGLPGDIGVSQAAQNFAGYSQVPSSLPTFARAAVAAPGFSPAPGFTSNPTDGGTAAPASPGAPATGTPNTATGQPDTSVPSHLSVPTGVTNTLAGLGLGALGPIGAGLAGINTISGLLGGPTIGSALNGLLGSNSGVAASPIGGLGDNSSQPGASYPTLPAPYGPSTGSDAGSVTSADGSTSSGVSPFDPHAAAMAAYNAAMASRPPATASAGAYDGTARPLVIHRGRSGYTPAPVYNPMQDPSVLHALGME